MGHTRGSSVYTKAMLRPVAAAGIAAATVALAGAAWRFRGSMSRRSKAKLEQKPAGNPSELGFGVS